MKRKYLIEYSVVTLLALAWGCSKQNASDAKSDTAAESKVVDVAKLDKDGDEELAAPNKAEARQWLKVPAHAVFKGSKETVIKFVEEFYAAGAVTVYVTGIETLGGNEVIDTMLLVLPKDSAARAKVFEVANRANEEFGNDPDKDVGQKYLSFVLD